MTALKITEIFHSIQGEAGTIGWPTVFVRLTGCPMRCVYCDTAYAFHGGSKMALNDIVAEVESFATKHVTVTGGEPLAQPNCFALLSELCDRGYQVSLETGGAIDISSVDPRVYIVLDVKTPASGEEPNNKYGNLEHIKSSDALKFVLCNEADYQWASKQVTERQLSDRCEVFFSPSAEQLDATQLADWIVRDKLAVRMQVQLHKILWNNEAGR
ncbi:MAG: 7-carboxy-7-deazaguanine synthase QueE [Gammaproteobacteria bacterium]|nr:7-carboxy-7-deazaguanine synthase QueE [Gammaproteobacteria bacterium]